MTGGVTSAPPADRRVRPGAIVAGALQAALVIGYPFLAVAGVALLGARAAALLLLALFALGQLRNLVARPREARAVLAMAALIAAPLLLAALLDDPRLMLAVPTIVNLLLLAQFGLSLRRGPPMVERFARLQASDLSAAEVRYCRSVTVLWCAFFTLNGAATALLAALAPRGWWALYTGAIAYVLMGALFAGEYLVRKARFGRFGPGLLDRLLARLLPRASAR